MGSSPDTDDRWQWNWCMWWLYEELSFWLPVLLYVGVCCAKILGWIGIDENESYVLLVHLCDDFLRVSEGSIGEYS